MYHEKFSSDDIWRHIWELGFSKQYLLNDNENDIQDFRSNHFFSRIYNFVFSSAPKEKLFFSLFLFLSSSNHYGMKLRGNEP